jgi:hypothetical protein
MCSPAEEGHTSPARLLRAIGSYFLYEPHTFTFVATDTNYITTDQRTNISSNRCCADNNNYLVIFKVNRPVLFAAPQQ